MQDHKFSPSRYKFFNDHKLSIRNPDKLVRIENYLCLARLNILTDSKPAF
jgi:hypothetical protein